MNENTLSPDEQIKADGKRHRQEEKEFLANANKGESENDNSFVSLMPYLNEIIGADLRTKKPQHQHERDER